MSNEQSKVVTKVVDVRHKAPDQAIHELMQAAKDGFAVTKIATRFNHTHVYLETSSKQIAESTKAEEAVEEASKESEKAEVKAETVKPVAKKTTAKTVTTTKDTTTKKVEPESKDSE